jgi:hypothetical protein
MLVESEGYIPCNVVLENTATADYTAGMSLYFLRSE